MGEERKYTTQDDWYWQGIKEWDIVNLTAEEIAADWKRYLDERIAAQDYGVLDKLQKKTDITLRHIYDKIDPENVEEDRVFWKDIINKINEVGKLMWADKDANDMTFLKNIRDIKEEDRTGYIVGEWNDLK